MDVAAKRSPSFCIKALVLRKSQDLTTLLNPSLSNLPVDHGTRRFLVISLMALLCMALASCQTTTVSNQPSYLTEISLAEVVVDFSNAQRPLLVADLDGEISAEVSTTALGALGTRLGVTNQQGRQTALEQAIAANVRPHVDDALRPLFTGSRPVRAIVTIRSVFIRSRFGLQQLTGTQVFINGQQRPDNPQFVAGLTLIDQATGLPIQEVEPITRVDDGAITIMGGGPAAPKYGKSARLNQLAFDYAQAAANAIQRNASQPNFSIPGREGDITSLF